MLFRSRGAWIALAIVTVAWPLVAGTGSWLRRFAMALGAGLAVAFMVAILWSMVPIVRERLTALGLDPAPGNPEQFATWVRDEIERWARVAKASGAKAD